MHKNVTGKKTHAFREKNPLIPNVELLRRVFNGNMLQYHHWHAAYRPCGWRGRMGFNRGVIWLASMAVYGCAHGVWLCAMMVLRDEAHERLFGQHWQPRRARAAQVVRPWLRPSDGPTGSARGPALLPGISACSFCLGGRLSGRSWRPVWRQLARRLWGRSERLLRCSYPIRSR